MRKNPIILILFLCFLTLFQISFLNRLFPFLPNLVLILIILINFFENQKDSSGILAALSGGFFLDIFSQKWFGYYILISILISIFIKLVVKKYIK